MPFNEQNYGLDNQSNTSHRRRNRKAPKKAAAIKALALLTVVVCCGFGATKLFDALTQSQPIVIAQAAINSNADTIEEDIVVLELPDDADTAASDDADAATTSDDDNTVTPDDLPVADGTPDYSEDALVVSYLDVDEAVTPHPLLNDVAPDVATEGSAGAGIANAPVDLGGSGFANIAAWKKTNSDTVGWLKIPGTNINYPVLQGPYTNYYTKLGYNKKYSKQGVIWSDSACGTTSLSPNTVLYGHNWTNYGSVPRIGSASDTHFAQLTAFQHLSFAKTHPYLWYSNSDTEMQWQIFAAFYTDISFNYIDASGGQAIIDGAKARSEHVYDVPVSADDKIITLSTCTRRFGSSNRQRFVVMAKLVDSASSSVSITANPHPVRPRL